VEPRGVREGRKGGDAEIGWASGCVRRGADWGCHLLSWMQGIGKGDKRPSCGWAEEAAGWLWLWCLLFWVFDQGVASCSVEVCREKGGHMSSPVQQHFHLKVCQHLGQLLNTPLIRF
jgi:hypothetical protein